MFLRGIFITHQLIDQTQIVMRLGHFGVDPNGLIDVALAQTSGRRQDAARLLGWGRNTLTRKIKELDESAYESLSQKP